MSRSKAIGPVLLVLGLLLTACVQKMTVQPYYRPLEPAPFFPDGRSARPLEAGVVSRDAPVGDPLLTTGMVGGQPADMFPFAITRDVLARGQERFNIYCVPCHGRLAEGDGPVVQRGFTHPPSFHTEALRAAPAGHFFDVITNGFKAMPEYGSMIPVRDRWAIVAYIRALQLSQDASPGDVPAAVRDQLTGSGGR